MAVGRNCEGSTRNASKFILGLINIHPPPQSGFPTLDAGDKKFNSRFVAPTIFLTMHFFGCF